MMFFFFSDDNAQVRMSSVLSVCYKTILLWVVSRLCLNEHSRLDRTLLMSNDKEVYMEM